MDLDPIFGVIAILVGLAGISIQWLVYRARREARRANSPGESSPTDDDH
jgi:hypothetical protein